VTPDDARKASNEQAERIRPVIKSTPFVSAAVLLVGLLGTNPGCASKNSADLRLTCLESDKAFSQRFSDAYVSKGAEGNTEIMLVNDTEASASGASGARVAREVIQPSGVRQVMHVKVLWRPQRGAKQGHPSYTNAGLHWYVFNDNGNGTSDVLEYSGAGFVALSNVSGGTKVTIRNATLKPVAPSRGSLSDPVGPAKLTGTFIAKKSTKRVQDLLAEVHSATTAKAQQASAR
jgi:hypothetical protein